MECKHNGKTKRGIMKMCGHKFIVKYQKCKECGREYYINNQLQKSIDNLYKAIEFDKIRWL